MVTQPGQTNVSAQLVKELRERTGAGFTACREALIESKGDIEQAISILRKKGQAAAQKKAQRTTSKGWWDTTFTRAENWRAGRNQLRERFRGADGRFSAALP